MSWVTGQHAYTTGRANPDFDRYHNVNRHIAGFTGIPMTVAMSGITRWDKFRYEPDGRIYHGRRKKPIGRYIKVERCGGIEVALRPGRLLEISELEALRWRLLLRIQDQLGPELGKRVRKVRRHARSFRGYYGGALYQITCRRAVEGVDQGIEFNPVDNDREKLEPLDRMAADWTPAEDDVMAAYFISMADRVARAWTAVSTVTLVLMRALDDRVKKEFGEKEYGEYVDVGINGRRYIVWVGRGGRFRNVEDLVELWPTPGRRSLEVNSAAADPVVGSQIARYDLQVSDV